ncbi:MAG TPA: CinA family nicotinamide mononucleotide deamidase-related protein [Thermoanaerobaculia bacterium]|jgi:nicotinamide-nucleotide amidase|nr:CinA family nicotinamide mononucleotide deamidase-related protein [Thermoanaerobaculia bacterium]
MNASIIAIGTEMLGPTRVDTNSLKVTAVLETYGAPLVRKSIAADSLADLIAEIEFAIEHCDVLITSGGLGPTEDDLTREALAEAFGLEMQVDQSIIDAIEERFRRRGGKMPEVNKRQANVFVGQTTLYNERGTAPGFHLEVRGKHVWVFPGVPHELEWMLETFFRPWLAAVSGGVARHRRVLKVAGLTESGVEERLKPYYAAHRDEPFTILASPGGIELHLVYDSLETIAAREREMLSLLGHHVFGYDNDTLEAVVGRMLAERHETLSTAESCTGGLLAQRITEVAGSSAYFIGGAVCYDAKVKVDVAGVDPELIRAHGEVSEEVAIALARGIRERFGTTYGVGITGIAGPGGGSEAKPVGTVHIAVATATSHEHRKVFWGGTTRYIVRALSAQTALDLLRRVMNT